MSSAGLERVKAIFAEAMEKVGPERAAFVEGACGGDARLRAEVEAFLSAALRAGDFFLSPTVEEAAPTVDAPGTAVREGLGSVIGRYKLLERLGEGGFGTVYMAEQSEPFQRRVALKIIKLGMDTKATLARFDAERQALAMMDHPNIARVFDAGSTETGRPYFVMELVRGVPITQYCDTNNLSTRERMELFVPVCRAVQHAHQKGIIHRDLKPSNVMVTMHDGVAVPKVIDFGIAKAMNARLTEKTLFTEFRQFIGTPEYMSPEQAEMSGLDIDTRADIYALGVLLYELLTGTTPFDGKELRQAAMAEIQRIIREVEPPKPSARLGTLGDTLTTVAAHRHTEPRKLGQLVRGELDWIVMKCLEKDRTRRYETASALAGDILRHLHDEPVEASPPSALYQIRKSIRKHRLTASVTFMFVLILSASTTVFWVLRNQALEDRRIAIVAEGRADALAKSESEQRRIAQQSEQIAVSEKRSTQLQFINALSATVEGQMNSGDFSQSVFDSLLQVRSMGEQNGMATTGADLMITNLMLQSPPPLYTASSIRSKGPALPLPDNRTLVCVDAAGKNILFINSVTGSVVRRIEIQSDATKELCALAISPDGSTLALAGRTTIELRSLSDGKVTRALKLPGSEQQIISDIAFSPGTSLIAATTHRDFVIHTVEKLTGDPKVDADRFNEQMRQWQALRPSLYVFDIRNPAPTRSCELPERFGDDRFSYSVGTAGDHAATPVRFSPEGALVYVGSYGYAAAAGYRQDNAVICFDPETLKIAGVLKKARDVRSVGLVNTNADGPQAFPYGPSIARSDVVLARAYLGRIQVFDVALGAVLRSFDCGIDPQNDLSFGRDLTTLFSSTNALRAWNLAERAPLNAIASKALSPRTIIGQMVFSRDSLLALTDPNSTSRSSPQPTVLWDLATCLPMAVLASSDVQSLNRRTALFSKDPGFCYIREYASIRKWDLRQRKVVESRRVNGDSSVFAIAPDERTCAVNEGRHIKILDLATDKTVYSSEKRSTFPTPMWYSPDGRWLFCFNSPDEPILVDIKQGRDVVTPNFPHHRSVDFSHDSKSLLCAAGASLYWFPLMGFGKSEAEVSLNVHGDIVDIAVASDGSLIACSSSDNTITFLDAATFAIRATFHNMPAGSLLMSPNGRFLRILNNESSAFLLDLRAGPEYVEAFQQAQAAREKLVSDPDDGPALRTLGVYYALRGADAWAVELLSRAAAGGQDVPALALARAHWKLGHLSDAKREFLRAIDRKEAPEYYLWLCVNAVENPVTIASGSRPSTRP